MQSQTVCSGCRTILPYPRGARDVRCAICDTVSPVQPTGLETDLIICGCCRTLLMYFRGVSSVRCLCCGTINPLDATPVVVRQLVPVFGDCASNNFFTQCVLQTTNGSLSSSTHRQNGVSTSSSPTASFPLSQSQTVVVENPMSLDRSGKLVSNVVVGVTQEKI